jgi:predicted glycosyltransferase involved in capsule biosynthesis
MKINIKDFTFLIPIRVDSIVRIENLLMSISYLLQYFETNIMVLEASDYNNGILRKLLDKRVEYCFREDKDPVFYRTKHLNHMTLMAQTPFIGIWDADVIIHKEQIIDSINKLREGYEIAYPYDGHFYDTSEIVRELYIREKKIDIFLKNKDKMDLPYGNRMVGGAIFVNKESYMQAGMENEKFYGWGPEDGDRYERFRIFRYKIYRSEGYLFHLTHSRGSNSKFRNSDHGINTIQQYNLTKVSSKEEIQSLIINKTD